MTDPNEASDNEEDASQAAMEANAQREFEQIAEELGYDLVDHNLVLYGKLKSKS